jgi:hypothetical protein
MRNKFINLFFQDLYLSLKIVAIVFLATFYFFLQKGAILKKLEAARLRQDKVSAQELARQIPGLEKKLDVLREKGIVRSRKTNFILSGIFIKDDKPVALIGENIYQKNDTIDSFMILEITLNGIVLEDQSTKEKREVRLPK